MNEKITEITEYDDMIVKKCSCGTTPTLVRNGEIGREKIRCPNCGKCICRGDFVVGRTMERLIELWNESNGND